MMIDKRGISGVVVAILIVLIAVIAVTIFWVALRPSIEQTVENIGVGEDCLHLSMNIESATYDDATDELTVRVFRDAGEANLQRVVVMYDDKRTEKIGADVPLELGGKTYTITGVTTKPSEVRIGGILGEDVTCPVSDTATVS